MMWHPTVIVAAFSHVALAALRLFIFCLLKQPFLSPELNTILFSLKSNRDKSAPKKTRLGLHVSCKSSLNRFMQCSWQTGAYSHKVRESLLISFGVFSVSAPQPKAPEVVKKKEVAVSPQAAPTKVARAPPEPTACHDAESSPGQLTEKDHEPRLGPRPRSHNRVLNPPGGKSSVVFYWPALFSLPLSVPVLSY